MKLINLLVSSSLFTSAPLVGGVAVQTDQDFYGQSPPIYPSPHGNGTRAWAPAYAAARALVGQMTLVEKVNITRGFPSLHNACHGSTGSVPRLGWPGMCLQDAGNGVRGVDLANSYPSGIHVGASWDKDLAYLRGLHMGNEFRIKGANVALGPVAGPLGRTALGGRNWEGFAADPYLTGVLSAETIKGIQDAGVIANLKHLIANEQETWRRPYNGTEAASSNMDDRTMHELYLWPFMDGIRAGAASVMCSYNRVNNSYGCQNSKLMNGILKTELDFDGFVISDWNAQHSGVASALAGLDMVMPTAGFWGDKLTEAVKNGSVPEDRVADMATRILAAWFFLDQNTTAFSRPGIGIQDLGRPHQLVDARRPEAKPVLLEGAIAGHVLVKNVNRLLPLERPTMLSIFGYDAQPPPTKNIDELYELGYESQPEMAAAHLGYEAHFSQRAPEGVIFSGGRSGSNGPAYIDSPFGALTERAKQDGTYLNWDLVSGTPRVNPMSDACLVFINAMATEGWDRDGLHDDFSDGLVLHVAARCARTVVVVHAAGIRLVDRWIDHPNVTAALLAHLPGQDLGAALVRILYGDVSPSGRLPYTLARNESDYGALYAPCGERAAAEGDRFPQCDYDEGLYIDYRHFDAKDITPRFEFGFGLSYTTFSYEQPEVVCSAELSGGSSQKVLDGGAGDGDGEGGSIWDVVRTVSVDITNTGHMTGAEVAQLYVGIPNAPEKQLRGFGKVTLAPGERAGVTFELTRRDLSIWDVVSQSWVVQRGRDRQPITDVKTAPVLVTEVGGSGQTSDNSSTGLGIDLATFLRCQTTSKKFRLLVQDCLFGPAEDDNYVRVSTESQQVQPLLLSRFRPLFRSLYCFTPLERTRRPVLTLDGDYARPFKRLSWAKSADERKAYFPPGIEASWRALSITFGCGPSITRLDVVKSYSSEEFNDEGRDHVQYLQLDLQSALRSSSSSSSSSSTGSLTMGLLYDLLLCGGPVGSNNAATFGRETGSWELLLGRALRSADVLRAYECFIAADDDLVDSSPDAARSAILYVQGGTVNPNGGNRLAGPTDARDWEPEMLGPRPKLLPWQGPVQPIEMMTEF